VVSTCRPDVVIVVVYPQQKIRVPFATIEEMGPPALGKLTRIIAVELLKNHGLGVDELEHFSAYDITGLGHAGVCVIDGKEETAYYYEYGRYDKANRGIVQHSPHFGKSQLVEFEDDNPTMPALGELCEMLKITNTPNDPQNFHAIYVKLPRGRAKTLNNIAKSQMPNKRQDYNLHDNHCMSFAIELAEYGGVNVSAARNVAGYSLTEKDTAMVSKQVEEFDFTPEHYAFLREEAKKALGKAGGLAGLLPENSLRQKVAEGYIQGLEEGITKMQPPSLMILALQEIWNRLNYAPMDFEGFTPFALMPKSLMRMHQYQR